MPDRMMSSRIIFTMVLTSAFLHVATVNINAFDCRRAGVDDCVSGQGECGTVKEGVCHCQSGFLSYDCSYDSSTSGSGCGSQCGDNAHCLSDNTCLCPETHYNGARGTCEYKTLQNMCSVNNVMLLNVNVPGVEGLVVYVEGREATCSLKSDGSTIHPAMPRDWRGKVVAVNMVDPTKCGLLTVSTVNGLERRCVNVYTRYSSDAISSLDKRVTFCCQDSVVDGLTAVMIDDLEDPPPPTTTPSSRGSSGTVLKAYVVLAALCIVHIFTRCIV